MAGAGHATADPPGGVAIGEKTAEYVARLMWLSVPHAPRGHHGLSEGPPAKRPRGEPTEGTRIIFVDTLHTSLDDTAPGMFVDTL